MPAPWTTVPVPPHIARLPRSAAGMPVPYNASWGLDHDRVEFRPGTGPTLICTCAPGDHDRPRFGEQCPQRQRHAMLTRLCSICGTAIKPTSRLVFFGSTSQLPYFVEPPTHPRCMAYAVRVCPKLSDCAERSHIYLTRTYTLTESRLGLDPRGQVVRARFAPGDLDGWDFGPLDYLFAELHDARTIPVPVWLAEHAPPLT